MNFDHSNHAEPLERSLLLCLEPSQIVQCAFWTLCPEVTNDSPVPHPSLGLKLVLSITARLSPPCSLPHTTVPTSDRNLTSVLLIFQFFLAGIAWNDGLWVFTRYSIKGLFRCFEGTCCFQLMFEWIWFW